MVGGGRFVIVAGAFFIWAGAGQDSVNAQPQLELRTVAISGQAAPGTSAVYGGLSSGPVIDPLGRVAFLASLSGPGVDATNNGGLWSETRSVSGEPGLIVRSGQAAPGTEPGTAFRFISFGGVLLDDAGNAAVLATLTGAAVNDTNVRGVWSDAGGTLALVAREGDPVQGINQATNYASIFNPRINGDGYVAFEARLGGSGSSSVIWSGRAENPNTPRLLVRPGMTAMGLDPGVVLNGLGSVLLNSSGQIAFGASLSGPGVDETNNAALFSEAAGSPGMPGLVVRTGDPVPGAASGALFTFFFGDERPYALNGSGRVAFAASYATPGESDLNGSGVWSDASGTLALVAQSGDPAPGTEPGVEFRSLFIPVINNTGHTAFVGTLQGPGVDSTNNFGIWSEAAGAGGSLGFVVRKGTQAAGTAEGVLFGSIDENLLINNTGQIAFRARLQGPGVDSSNDQGIWIAGADGVLTLVAREGDQFDTNDDPQIQTLRTIEFVSFSTSGGAESGIGGALNDAGQLSFQMRFTDGTSGIFVAMVPEPTSVLALAFGGVGLTRRRR